LQHKYQINIDGTVAAYRLPYLLVGDSVVLKQDSIYYEHFYNELQPWKHYIPVKSNLSDLLEKLKWAKEHDAEVRSAVKKPCSLPLVPCYRSVGNTPRLWDVQIPLLPVHGMLADHEWHALPLGVNITTF
jgi:hypothetical protein